ncbi:MAG: di/tricarboxylate transporter [Verrucomicrobiales bacterium]|jgi:di/tricarboxylate transporter
MIDQTIIVYILLGVVILAFFREWAPPDVVALSAMMVVWATGVLSTDDMLAVFSNPAPITVAAMFVLSAGLERTGCIDIIGDVFAKVAGTTETRVLIVMMVLAAVLSAFINNTPIVVVFLPVVVALSRRSDLKASRLLIPLSFASILGGTCTLTGTSTNLIIDGAAQDVFGSRGEAYQPFTMFEVSKLGLIYAAIGFVYMLTLGRKLLPTRESLQAEVAEKKKRHFLTQVLVEDESPLVGKTLVETLIKEFPEARILEVRRGGSVLSLPLDKLVIESRDRIRLTVHGGSFEDFKKTGGLQFPAQRHLHVSEMETQQLQFMEGVIGPQSSLVGKTLRELRFRQRYGVLIMAVHRKGVDLRKRMEQVRLKVGDTVLLEGSVDGMNRLGEAHDFLIMDQPPKRDVKLPSKRWIATGIVVAFIIGASVGGLPISGLAMLAAVAMLATRCLEPKEAYGSVQWTIIFMIFGMLALGKAMESSGGAKQIADLIESGFGNASPIIILGVVYLLSSTMTELISNNAVAALITPIVIGIAANIGMDARPFIVAVMFGCSASFATPIGYQTNTYVYGAGGYRFSDFPKVGVPLNLILWITATLVIPLLWDAGLTYSQWWTGK